jgi:hypothetical protein
MNTTRKYYAVVLYELSIEVEEYQFGLDQLTKGEGMYPFVGQLLEVYDQVIDLDLGESMYFNPTENPLSKGILKRIA